MAEFTEKVRDFFTNAEISNSHMMNLLSEFLAVEMGGEKLYVKALTLVFDPEVKSKFKEYLDQTRHHQKVLTDIIKRLGGNPKMQSPTAKLAAEKGQALLRSMIKSGLSKEQKQLNAMENIVLAETKDHSDWELLGKIARQTNDGQLRDVLTPAVKEVEDQEDEHLNWTRTKMAELAMLSLTQENESNQTKARNHVDMSNGRARSPGRVQKEKSNRAKGHANGRKPNARRRA
jgi:rubrerythrin